MRKIFLSPHDPKWQQQFATESAALKKLLAEHCHRIFHIGSTAIKKSYAKPIVDILIAVEDQDLSMIDRLNAQFEQLGYHCMGEYGIKERRYYWKGTPAHHTFHIHLFYKWNAQVIRHLAFRDYMNQHTDVARCYSWIKRCLAEQFVDDMLAYVNAKESFIRMIDYRTGAPKQDQMQASDHIVLEDYNPHWQKLARAEINAIKKTVGLPYVRIEHLGSTAIKNLKAKPIIDIFIAIKTMAQAKQWITPLENMGYLFCYGNPSASHLRFFKGIPPCGMGRTHHIHILQDGVEFERRIAFRDALNRDDQLRKKYEALKLELVNRYVDDRETYTQEKLTFINDVLNSANQ